MQHGIKRIQQLKFLNAVLKSVRYNIDLIQKMSGDLRVSKWNHSH